MKLFGGFLKGALAGIVLAIVVFIGNKALPFITCTGQLFCGTLTCNGSMCEDACVSASKANNCEDAIPANYKSTTVFSVILCVSIGVIWGISATISDAAAANRLRAEQREKELAENNKANAEAVLKELNGYIKIAGEVYVEETTSSIYNIDCKASILKDEVEVATTNYLRERERLKEILKSQKQ